jgi:hypothetical protein
MRELMTFELITNTADDVKFIDKFDVLSDKAKLRLEILEPNKYKRNAYVKVFVTIDKNNTTINENSDITKTSDTSNHLALWEYLGRDEETKEEQWVRMGGKIETINEADENIKIFMAVIRSTGIFTIFDENPPVSYVPPFPIDQIEKTELSPFPSVKTTNNKNRENSKNKTYRSIGPINNNTSQITNIKNQENFDNTDERIIPSIKGNTNTNNEIKTDSQIPPVQPNTEHKTTTTNTPLSPTENLNTNIPPDAILPQSGQEEKESISLLFPFILIGILGVMGMGIFLAIQKNPY